VQAQAQVLDIDPLLLPPSGLERAYACRSNLNATSAMMQAQKMEKQGKALLGLYLVLDGEVISQAKAAGVSEADYQKRMTAWDAAVVVASLKHTDAVLKNMAPCMKMAAEIYNGRTGK
jgi:hypothetical protein